MSIESTLLRIGQLQGMLAATTAATPTAPQATTVAATSRTLQADDDAETRFSSVLRSTLGTQSAAGSPGPSATNRATNAGVAALKVAEGEVGQAEQPPGSNDSPRIATYRRATAGSGVGPWCAYFVSWAARQAGVPLGENGQGYGAVADVASWAQRTGRSLAAGSTPRPGDLIIWGSRHIGIVESVGSDGSIHTIEGNSSDRVSRRTYGADGGGATSYVRLG